MPISGLVAALGTEAVATMPSGSKGPLPPNEDADNPLYKEDNFRMWCLKVLPCSKRYCHDWTTCPWAHAQEKAKRRDPRVYNYTGVACPEMKKSMQCPRGDQCPYAHNVFEYWLHHSRYRTQLCNDGVGCKRKICFFAHTLDELRVSSVKVQVPEGFRGEINSTAINPFAPSHSNSGSGKHNQASAAAQNGGNGYHGPRNGGQAGAGAANSGLSMAELQQFAALQAKMQASQQQQGTDNGTPGQLNNAMSGDQAAIDQLVQLMLMAQQQPQQQQQQQQQGSMVDPMTQMMAQVMLGQQQQAQQQQQQQAAAALQVQQQMAALQLLNQMQGLGAGYMQDPYNGGAAMGMGQEMMNGGPPQRYNSGVQSYSRGNSYTHQNSNLSQSRSPMPQAHQMQDMSDSVNELARQLSGLSASGKIPPALMTSSGGMGGNTSDGPGSARSFNSGGTPGGRQGSSRIARQHTQDSNGAMGAVGMSMKAQGGDGGAGGQPHGSQVNGASARNPLLQHTSPVSISALGDGYATTATANSFFSASHSLTSSHDGSDLEVSHH